MQIDLAEPGHDPAERTSTGGMTDTDRAVVYRWLSGIFAREPSIETLSVYRSPEGRTLLKGLASIPTLSPVVDEIQFWSLHASEADLRVIALDLACEFAQLFSGVAGRRSAPPYQSFYVGENSRLMQDAAAEMQYDLRALDVRTADGFREPPDHIAVQLAVMAELVEGANPDRQAEYLNQRLSNWISDFRDRCMAKSSAGFYSSAARALVDFLETDAAAIEGRIAK